MIEDEILVKKIQEDNDSSALSELSERHSGIYIKIVTDYMPNSLTSDVRQEFYDSRERAIYEAAKSYDEDKGAKFVTWLGNYTKYKCLTEKSKLSKQPSFCEFSEEHGEYTDLSPDSYLETKDSKEYFLDYLKTHCSEDQFKVVSEKYFGGSNNCGKTFVDIGNEMGFTTQWAKQLHDNAINKIRKKIKYDSRLSNQ